MLQQQKLDIQVDKALMHSNLSRMGFQPENIEYVIDSEYSYLNTKN